MVDAPKEPVQAPPLQAECLNCRSVWDTGQTLDDYIQGFAGYTPVMIPRDSQDQSHIFYLEEYCPEYCRPLVQENPTCLLVNPDHQVKQNAHLISCTCGYIYDDSSTPAIAKDWQAINRDKLRHSLAILKGDMK